MFMADSFAMMTLVEIHPTSRLCLKLISNVSRRVRPSEIPNRRKIINFNLKYNIIIIEMDIKFEIVDLSSTKIIYIHFSIVH